MTEGCGDCHGVSQVKLQAGSSTRANPQKILPLTTAVTPQCLTLPASCLYCDSLENEAVCVSLSFHSLLPLPFHVRGTFWLLASEWEARPQSPRLAPALQPGSGLWLPCS